jgi:hypothetical protein
MLMLLKDKKIGIVDLPLILNQFHQVSRILLIEEASPRSAFVG